MVEERVMMVGVIFGVVVVCNEDGIFQLRRFLGKWNRPPRVLLDFNVQPSRCWAKLQWKVLDDQ